MKKWWNSWVWNTKYQDLQALQEAIREFNLDWVGYADDLMLTFDDKDSLQQGIILLDEIFTEYRLKINIKKTQTMIINHQYSEQEYPNSISSLRGKDIENNKNTST